MPPKITTQILIAQFKKVHGDTFDYSKVCYKGPFIKVEIICRQHGSFLTRPSSHSSGHGCTLCGRLTSFNINKKSTDDFIKKAQTKHGDYDYSLVKYESASKKVEIICPVHGPFWQLPSNHYQFGCQLCATNTKSNTQTFVKKSQEIHGVNHYDYSRTKYANRSSKVEIICKIHGPFFQHAFSHLKGCGCRKCSHENFNSVTHGYTKKHWLNTQKNRVAKFYFINCCSDKEAFLKIGITFNKIKTRFSGKNMPYNYDVVNVIESTNAECIWGLELDLKRQLKEFRYIPKIKFNGRQECYSTLAKRFIESHMAEFVCNDSLLKISL